ncbi:bestrophin family protein [Urechidicola vernalis]|uniref:Bestrophin family ion channel n=1 Tax=Urechidicola vernalis TaxID=3075600 RepID=A0ABU2Y0Q0_9FLAO|nr:bestrophin family ion channel [Urechidicola sp. P050]MDT0551751.1 bestrophin family ion channel [Urechidicola sp. P050]
MLTKKKYSIKDMVKWTRWETASFLAHTAIVVILFHVLEFSFLHVPWTPVALVGTAVAFIIGFQNSAAYGRIWEARKIWGGIVNSSRTWGMKVKDMVTNEYASDKVNQEELDKHIKALIYRHIGWITSLRYAMREPRTWEVFSQHRTNKEWSDAICIPEVVQEQSKELSNYLSDEELKYVLSKKNKAAACLYLQSTHLRKLKEKGLIWEFSFLELENLLEEFFTLQGKSERIKNFPYPRQYATLSYYFVWMFLILIPFGLVPEFAEIGRKMTSRFPEIGQYFIWAAIPFCGIVSWIFHTMMRIGTVGENPFEGTANDVPISTISRGIEIDLRQLMGEENESIPDQFPQQYDVQM